MGQQEGRNERPSIDGESCEGPAQGNPEKSIETTAHSLCAIKKILMSGFGHFEKEFTYRAGLEAANCHFERYSGELSARKDSEILEKILATFSKEEMGIFRVETYDSAHQLLRLSCSDSIEAMGFIEHGELQDSPECSFLCGFLAGVGKHILKGGGVGSPNEIMAIETSCASQGKERCEFVVAPRSKLEGLGVEMPVPHETSIERSFRLNEEILARNLDLQNLNLDLERLIRRRTEELNRSESNYRSLVDLSPDPVIICLSNGSVKTVNEAALEMLGLDSTDDILGESISSMLLDGENAWERCTWLVDKEGMVKDHKFTLVRRDGNKIEGEVSARHVDLQSERCLYMVIRDVTERNTLRQRMEQAEIDSAASSNLLSRDMVNRMTAALHFLEKGCQSDHLSEDDRKALELAKREVAAAYSLATVVRDWTRVAVLGESECSEATDVCVALSDAIEETKRIHFDRKVSINVTRPQTPCHALGSPLLGRMFFNLLTNAVKFDSSPSVLIDVTVEETEHRGEDFWCIRFEDRGRGIPDHEKEKIFERYHRGDVSVPGAGLGLHVARRIAKACGGLVWAENRMSGDFSKGTTMVVMLRKAGSRNNRYGQAYQPVAPRDVSG